MIPTFDRANVVRIEAARQRRELADAPLQERVRGIVHPTAEFGRYRLEQLFATRSSCARKMFRGVGPGRFQTVLRRLDEASPIRVWHSELRLQDLTLPERRRLVKALLGYSTEAA